MFHDVGRKIKGFARVVFVLMIIGTLTGALAAAIVTGKVAAYSCGGNAFHSAGKDEVTGFFAGLGVFLLIAAIGIIVSWIFSLFLYAIGQYVEDTELNRETNQDTNRLLRDIRGLLKSKANETPSEAVTDPVSGTVRQKTDPVRIVTPVAVSDGKVRCPLCDTVQPENRSVSFCGIITKTATAMPWLFF